MDITQSKYTSALSFSASQKPTKPSIATFLHQQEKLQTPLEQFQSAQGKSRTKKQLLEITYQTLSQKKRLQTAHQKNHIQDTLLEISINTTNYIQPGDQLNYAQQLESLNTFTSQIVHDLNNIFSPILAISQLLRSRNPDLSEQSQELLKILENSAKRGANLTQQILTYSRASFGEHQPTQITPLLQESLDTAKLTFQKSIRIDHHHYSEQPLWLVAANVTQLHQLLMNLFINAHDAMSDGGGLTVSAENCFIDQAFTFRHPDAQAGNYVVIVVTDTGTGIPPEVRARIFEPFFTTKPVGQGSGLGLVTVLEIVKAHGGFLHILSEVGRGTSVKVYLPAQGEF